MTNVTPIRDENLMRLEDFADHLGQMLGVPPPKKRWVSERCKDGMPSKLVLKRYKMVYVDAAIEWLRGRDYL